jgi:hypothetical protein
MEGYLHQMWGGPGHARFFLQPAIAILLGLRAGLRDHRHGKSPFLHTVVRDWHRGGKVVLLDALRGLIVPLCIAMSASLLFQWVIRKELHLIPGLLYALLFVALPYVAARGFSNRAAGLRGNVKQT